MISDHPPPETPTRNQNAFIPLCRMLLFLEESNLLCIDRSRKRGILESKVVQQYIIDLRKAGALIPMGLLIKLEGTIGKIVMRICIGLETWIGMALVTPIWFIFVYYLTILFRTTSVLTFPVADFNQKNMEFNKLALQAIGGLAAFLTIYYAARRIKFSEETLRINAKAQEINAETLRINTEALRMNMEGQITERFTKAIEQLGATDTDGLPKIEVRLGGIYALERIARDSKDDHWTVMEVLTAYVRENAPWIEKKDAESKASGETKRRPRTDIQAVLTVIGRRKLEREKDSNDYLNLSNTDLRGADLREAHLEEANLYNARLEKVNLRKAHLGRACLIEAHLEGARLIEAHLEGTGFYEAHLEGADLSGAHLEKALVSKAHLEGANLSNVHMEESSFNEASLVGAKLIAACLNDTFLYKAHLEKADLSEANLRKAYLHEAHLEGANLLAAHLEEARLNEAHLESAELSGAHLEGAELFAAHLEEANLSKAYLEKTSLLDTHLEGTDLSHVQGLTQAQIDLAIVDEKTKLPDGLINRVLERKTELAKTQGSIVEQDAVPEEIHAGTPENETPAK